MRILAVGSLYPPHHYGGYEIVWQSVMRRALAEGHTVRILASDYRRPDAGPEQERDVSRVLRWYWDWDLHRFPRLTIAERWRLERHNATVFERHVAEFRPDVVSWWLMGAMSLSLIERARRARLASVLAVHDDWLVYGPRADAWTRFSMRLGSLAKWLEPAAGIPMRLALSDAGRFLFNSNHTRDTAARAGFVPADGATITPGIDEWFLRTSAGRVWAWRLLYVGRVDRMKGVDIIIDALAELPCEATLTIAGDGDAGYLGELHAQVSRLKLSGRVHFLGIVARDDLPQVYSEADVITFAPRWEEPWGLVPLEAMGIGRPVVASATGGSAEFLRDGENAVLFEAGAPSKLAAAVRLLADSPSLRRALVRGGASTAAQHTAEEFDRRLLVELEAAAGLAL